jgi:CheY-like chemotaxis protein
MSSSPHGLGPTVCWNCDEVVDETIEAFLEVPPGEHATLRFCPSCYVAVYVPLAADAPELRLPQDGSRSVLIVDDDPDILGMLTTFFVDEGFSVDTARDGLEALNKASTHVTDAIVLDLHMPVMDGQAFLQAWRQTTSNPTVPVLAISAYHVELTADELNVNAYLPKPFDISQLSRAVD